MIYCKSCEKQYKFYSLLITVILDNVDGDNKNIFKET